METALGNDAEDSATYFGQLAELSRRLDEVGIALYSHRYDFLAFGSWMVEAGTRHRRVRVTYDGREGLLRFEDAFVHSSKSPIEWRERECQFVSRTAASERAMEAIVRSCRS